MGRVGYPSHAGLDRAQERGILDKHAGGIGVQLPLEVAPVEETVRRIKREG